MKRLGLALSMAVGALVLFFSASTGSTPAAQAAPPPVDNYCGVDGFDVPDTGEAFDFTQACKGHDDCYGSGGGATARNRCDTQFFRDMTAWCTSHWKTGDPRLGRCKTVASTYYTAVRVGGWIFFYS